VLIISNKKKLWEPSDEWIKNAEITKFIEYVNKKYGQEILTHINGETNHIVIGHTRWPTAAKEIADYIEQFNEKKKTIIIQETGAIVANFVGKKTLTIGYIGEYKEKWLSEIKK
jgi:hypothetical protein